MFKTYKHYKYIVVTGCQRAGTRICAKCFSEDTGHKYTDEVEFETYDLFKFTELFKGEPKVIHAPTMSSIVHHLHREDVLVVFVKRDRDDIFMSQVKLDWDSSDEEFNYNFPYDIINTTYDYAKLQAKYINYLEVEYESLRTHPLWVSNRKFKWFQTKLQ